VNLLHLGEADNEATLLKRLKHLEGMLTKLSSHVEMESSSDTHDLETEKGQEQQTSADGTEGIKQDLGKLVMEQGHSRYISSQVWDNLIDEVR